MANILNIETSTSVCSVALTSDGQVIEHHENYDGQTHATLLSQFIKDALDSAARKEIAINAIAVSIGPGSYTGLRVGVSTAKGLCFGAGVPLLSAGTLDVLVSEAHRLGVVPEGCRAIVPMVDARRMEVYAAVFTPDGKQLTETKPIVVDADSFAAELAEGPVLFIGDGALKCREVLSSPNAHFAEAFPTAMAMASLAEAAWNEKRFEDVAYFEPFYLKDFVATVSRKKLF